MYSGGEIWSNDSPSLVAAVSGVRLVSVEPGLIGAGLLSLETTNLSGTWESLTRRVVPCLEFAG